MVHSNARHEAVQRMLDVLDLADTGARTREDIFTGHSEPSPAGRVFGGQVLAQAVVAASRTIDDRPIHSMHGYFLRPGDLVEPITFAVDRIHDGRSFSTRRTQAYQHGLPILSMIASFQEEQSGFEHQASMPDGVPDPDSLPSTDDLFADIDHPAAEAVRARPFEIRHTEHPIYLPHTSASAQQALWIRAAAPLPDDPALHRAALAYASDFALLEPVLRAHGLFWAMPGLKVASLDHAMWWHRPTRADEWLLFVQQSPSAQGGRGLAQALVFSRDGTLVASVAQEGTVRAPRE